jgi:hypothetical protein
MWRRVVAEYDMGLASLDVLHQGLLALDKARDARAVLDSEGVIQVDRFGQSKPHPAASVYKAMSELYLKAMSLLRLDLEPVGDIGRPPGK